MGFKGSDFGSKWGSWDAKQKGQLPPRAGAYVPSGSSLPIPTAQPTPPPPPRPEVPTPGAHGAATAPPVLRAGQQPGVGPAPKRTLSTGSKAAPVQPPQPAGPGPASTMAQNPHQGGYQAALSKLLTRMSGKAPVPAPTAPAAEGLQDPSKYFQPTGPIFPGANIDFGGGLEGQYEQGLGADSPFAGGADALPAFNETYTDPYNVPAEDPGQGAHWAFDGEKWVKKKGGQEYAGLAPREPVSPAGVEGEERMDLADILGGLGGEDVWPPDDGVPWADMPANPGAPDLNFGQTVGVNDVLNQALKDLIIDQPGLSDEEIQGQLDLIKSQAAQAKANESQNLAARGMGASGVGVANLGGIDAQALNAAKDLVFNAATLREEQQAQKLGTLAGMYGQDSDRALKEKMFDETMDLEQDKWFQAKLDQKEASAWAALQNMLALTGSDAYTAGGLSQALGALQKWAHDEPGGMSPSEVMAQLMMLQEGKLGWNNAPGGGDNEEKMFADSNLPEGFDTNQVPTQEQWPGMTPETWASMSPQDRAVVWAMIYDGKAPS